MGNALTQPVPPMALLASTGLNGFALQNGTPTILTWTAPNDGNPHRVVLYGSRNVTVAETGGAVTFNVPLPGGGTLAAIIEAGGAGVGQGAISSPGQGYMVPPGATVTVTQSSALTAGACVNYLELWGS